ncbi:MAG: translation initiation factor IF-2 [Planctomycetota bacterium]|nr:translation initiation factor IF-2 [Planctomycetota bacterium]
MAVRIYSLAKEMGLDSKELVDLCTRIGILNKGSALASLEDEEVSRVKKHVATQAAGALAAAAPIKAVASSSATAAPVAFAPERPSVKSVGSPIRQIGRPAVIGRAKPKVVADAETIAASSDALPQTISIEPDSRGISTEESKVEIAAKAPSIDLPDSLAVEQPVAESSAEPKAESGGEARDQQSSAPVRQDSNPRPGIVTRGIRVIGARPTKAGEGLTKAGGGEERKKRQNMEPVINLKTRIPKTAAPPPTKSNEVAAQKPEIRLTPDMIAGGRQGMRAPLEKLQQDTAKAVRGPAAPPPGSGVAAGGGLKKFKDAAERAAQARGTGKKSVAEIAEEGKAAAAARLDRSKRGRDNKVKFGNFDDEGDGRRRRGRHQSKAPSTAAPRKDKVILDIPCTVRSFCEAAGVPVARVLRSLMTMGIPTSINANLDAEQALLLATELGVEVEFREAVSAEASMLDTLEKIEDAAEDLIPRAPIVTFLGHVDHGKTSLLDYLIGTKIVAGEAGGITQHIRAYQVEKDGRKVAFVDTPGHEAFTEMRARGANVTDIAVLVIAADDGIMPQTEEAISHAKAAGVPIVVAANKADLPSADINRLMTQMTEHGLTPSAWGGDVEVVPTSAITGLGMDELLDTLLTVAELNDYKANPKRAAIGVCLESEQASDRGIIAKMMVQNGTLRVGDIVVCGSTYGRVKAIYDTLRRNKQLTEAGPSMPVNITGLEHAPDAGEKFYVLDDIQQAREIAAVRGSQTRSSSLSGTTKVSFEAFQELIQSGRLTKRDEDKVILNLIIRADARGSLEAIEKELTKLDHPEVELKILQRSVGGISVADVTLASASGAVIVGFNVIPDEAARGLADQKNVEIRRYDIIYNLALDIKAIVEGRLKPAEKVVELGRALVKQVFSVSRVGTIAGCYVVQGSIERGCRIRVNRDGRTIGDYPLDTLRRVKDDVKEVLRGLECGIKLSGFNDVKQDDILEAYKIEEVARTLDMPVN